MEQPVQLVRRNCTAEEVSLSFVAIVIPKKLEIFSRFNSLSNNPEIKAPSQADECFHCGRSTWKGGDLTDKRPVDLDGVEGKFPHAAQAGVARAEIIDGHMHALIPERLEDGN